MFLPIVQFEFCEALVKITADDKLFIKIPQNDVVLYCYVDCV